MTADGEPELEDDLPESPPAWAMGTYVLTGVLTVLLLGVHTLSPDDYTVDTTSLGLLAVLLVLPVAHRITKLKLGGLEAEVSERKARKRIDAANVSLSASEAASDPELSTAPSASAADNLSALASVDEPAQLLALDRLALERELRRFVEIGGLDAGGRGGIGRLTALLQKSNLLPADIAAAIREVAPVLNSGAHGEIDAWDIAFATHETTQRLVAIVSLLASRHQLAP